MVASMLYNVVGASLNEPHIDHENGPCMWNNSIHVSIIYLAFCQDTGTRALTVRTELLVVFLEDYRCRQVGECAGMV